MCLCTGKHSGCGVEKGRRHKGIRMRTLCLRVTHSRKECGFESCGLGWNPASTVFCSWVQKVTPPPRASVSSLAASNSSWDLNEIIIQKPSSYYYRELYNKISISHELHSPSTLPSASGRLTLSRKANESHSKFSSFLCSSHSVYKNSIFFHFYLMIFSIWRYKVISKIRLSFLFSNTSPSFIKMTKDKRVHFRTSGNQQRTVAT